MYRVTGKMYMVVHQNVDSNWVNKEYSYLSLPHINVSKSDSNEFVFANKRID